MQRFSVFTLARNAIGSNRDWQAHWRQASPKSDYDIVIVGGGGHGLATAYYLARRHGLRRVAVLEKGAIGAEEHTPPVLTVRPETVAGPAGEFFGLTRSLYRGLSRQLNFNIQFSMRGTLRLCLNEEELAACQAIMEIGNAEGLKMRMVNGRKIARLVPGFGRAARQRLDIAGALYQPKGAMVRADALAWAYARGADAQGIDIVENCEVYRLLRRGERITGVETSLGPIRARKVALVAGEASTALAGYAGLRLPLETAPFRAIMSEPTRPVLTPVVSVPGWNLQVYQDTTGRILASDLAPSDNDNEDDAAAFERLARGVVRLFPDLAALQLARCWSRPLSRTFDGNPLIGRTETGGLYVNCGWGAAALQTTPASGLILADAIAGGEPKEAAAGYEPGQIEAIAVPPPPAGRLEPAPTGALG
jgi:sarcosine oxidase subunit beta